MQVLLDGSDDNAAYSVAAAYIDTIDDGKSAPSRAEGSKQSGMSPTVKMSDNDVSARLRRQGCSAVGGLNHFSESACSVMLQP
jgi:hypothetical protein